MVCAGLPEDVLTAHPLEPDKHILKRVVERVAHVQHTGYVRRWNDDGIGLRRRIAGGFEAALVFPSLVQARFGFCGVKSLVEHWFRRIPCKEKARQ